MAIRVPLRLPAAFVADDDHALLARFAAERDESAFAAIVGRHARMVYGVCKRAVRDEHLAEDAFQAVFLVLAKNPGGASAASSLGGWLFGIARRVGLAARRHEERRHRREQQAAAPREHSPDFDDLMRVLDEELAALPEAYRAPLVACFLEERTQDEAARQLGWSLSTLRRRLERGKELLRARLTRRGATLAGGLLAGALAPSAAVAVPPRLVASASPAASPSALAQTLAAEVTRGAVGVKFALAAVVVAALGGLGFALAPSAEPTLPPREEPIAAPAPRPAPQAAWATLAGRVVFPEERDIPAVRVVPQNAIKDFEFFGVQTHRDVLIEPKTRGLANAVVWLRPDSDDPKAAFPADKLPASKGREHFVTAGPEGFTPRVLAVRAGDWVTFGNPTPIAFNVRYTRMAGVQNPMGGDTGEFNVLLPTNRTHTTKPLPPLRLPDLVSDMIHPWAKGYVWSFDHPYFAVTDTKGNFTIPNAPAGKWRLMVWHEKVGYRDGAKGKLGTPVTVTREGKLDLGRVVMSSPGWDEKDE